MSVIRTSEVSLSHGLVFRFHVEIIFDLFFQFIQKLIAVLCPVAEEFGPHVQVAALGFFVFIKIELVEKDGLVLIEDVPADAGIICDQHPAAHQHFIYRDFAEGDQMDPAAFGPEGVHIFLELRVKIKIHLQIVFLQNIQEASGIQKFHIIPEIIALFESLVGDGIQPVAPGRHDEDLSFSL